MTIKNSCAQIKDYLLDEVATLSIMHLLNIKMKRVPSSISFGLSCSVFGTLADSRMSLLNNLLGEV